LTPLPCLLADEWRHDDKTKGSTAIVKQNICTGKVQYWARPASFPTEAIFVGSDAPNRKEDEGVLLFVTLEGVERRSHFRVVDAITMQDVVDVQLPVMVPYAAHGQFYPGLLA